MVKIVLIVGPSGVGKDTLINSVKGKIDANFVKRYITRVPDSHEQNYFVENSEFEKLKKEGFFVSSWDAHSNQYGIALDEIKEGLNIISVSRSAIKDFEKVFDDVVTINISLSKDALYKRLKNRNRESENEIQERLASSDQDIKAKKLIQFSNDLPLDISSAKFLELLGEIK
ncbi:MAG: hypothetical protein R3331_09050 [Sulfurospirillaceae bacterium]|nr:hypothetical protein [Sulfurospirillaceae bacterium]